MAKERDEDRLGTNGCGYMRDLNRKLATARLVITYTRSERKRLYTVREEEEEECLLLIYFLLNEAVLGIRPGGA